MQQVPIETFSPVELTEARNRYANGLGGFTIIGDPDDVAGELAALHGAGLKGIAVSLVNYAQELPYFCTQVLPRLERMGLRVRG
jgi:alkanesulfonate monooxygenase SsuD/methylene tetrahydromethanopterin reductase-like flavin-dependent oxidoreductase (luciferase family)